MHEFIENHFTDKRTEGVHRPPIREIKRKSYKITNAIGRKSIKKVHIELSIKKYFLVFKIRSVSSFKR